MTYPDPAEIRKRLDTSWISPVNFLLQAQRVCAEAEKRDHALNDIQVIAQLQFIEKVLNG
jgi:hypothetical protein